MNAEQSNNSQAVNESEGNTYLTENSVAQTLQNRAKRNDQSSSVEDWDAAPRADLRYNNV